MGRDRLIVHQYDYKYRLTWYIAEDDDLGGSIGETRYSAADLVDGMPREDRDCAVAFLAAKTTPGARTSGSGKYDQDVWWETKAEATAALRTVNAALKADRSATPWPEWTKQATAAGWKPPKGWAP